MSPKKINNSHLFFAKSINQEVWQLLGRKKRSTTENELLVQSAHASCYHWLKVGTPAHHQRGLWLISRVYAVLNDPANALDYAERCLDMTKKFSRAMKDFDRAYAYEAVARAYALANRKRVAKKFIELAKTAGDRITDPKDRELFFEDFKYGNLLSRRGNLL